MSRYVVGIRDDLDDYEDTSWKRKSYALAQNNALPIPMPRPVYPPPTVCNPPATIRPKYRPGLQTPRYRHPPPPPGYNQGFRPIHHHSRPPQLDHLPVLSETTQDQQPLRKAPSPPKTQNTPGYDINSSPSQSAFKPQLDSLPVLSQTPGQQDQQPLRKAPSPPRTQHTYDINSSPSKDLSTFKPQQQVPRKPIQASVPVPNDATTAMPRSSGIPVPMPRSPEHVQPSSRQFQEPPVPNPNQTFIPAADQFPGTQRQFQEPPVPSFTAADQFPGTQRQFQEPPVPENPNQRFIPAADQIPESLAFQGTSVPKNQLQGSVPASSYLYQVPPAPRNHMQSFLPPGNPQASTTRPHNISPPPGNQTHDAPPLRTNPHEFEDNIPPSTRPLNIPPLSRQDIQVGNPLSESDPPPAIPPLPKTQVHSDNQEFGLPEVHPPFSTFTQELPPGPAPPPYHPQPTFTSFQPPVAHTGGSRKSPTPQTNSGIQTDAQMSQEPKLTSFQSPTQPQSPGLQTSPHIQTNPDPEADLQVSEIQKKVPQKRAPVSPRPRVAPPAVPTSKEPGTSLDTQEPVPGTHNSSASLPKPLPRHCESLDKPVVHSKPVIQTNTGFTSPLVPSTLQPEGENEPKLSSQSRSSDPGLEETNAMRKLSGVNSDQAGLKSLSRSADSLPDDSKSDNQMFTPQTQHNYTTGINTSNDSLDKDPNTALQGLGEPEYTSHTTSVTPNNQEAIYKAEVTNQRRHHARTQPGQDEIEASAKNQPLGPSTDTNQNSMTETMNKNPKYISGSPGGDNIEAPTPQNLQKQPYDDENLHTHQEHTNTSHLPDTMHSYTPQNQPMKNTQETPNGNTKHVPTGHEKDQMDSPTAQNLPLTPSSQSCSSSQASIGSPRTPPSIRAAPSCQPMFPATPLSRRATPMPRRSTSTSEASLASTIPPQSPEPPLRPRTPPEECHSEGVGESVGESVLPTPPSSPSQIRKGSGDTPSPSPSPPPSSVWSVLHHDPNEGIKNKKEKEEEEIKNADELRVNLNQALESSNKALSNSDKALQSHSSSLNSIDQKALGRTSKALSSSDKALVVNTSLESVSEKAIGRTSKALSSSDKALVVNTSLESVSEKALGHSNKALEVTSSLNSIEEQALGDGKAGHNKTLSSSTSESNNYQTYKARFWILTVFSFICFLQTIVWGTFGPIAESAQAAFPTWDDSTIAAFPNWGPIIVVVFIFPMVWLSHKLGLQAAMIICELFLTLGTMIRCFTSQELVFTVMCHVSSVLFAFAACFTLSLPAMIAATWFPPNERITATAVGTLMCQLGGAAMYLGALMVRYPSSDDSAKLTDFERQDIRSDIMTLMYIHFGGALVLLIAVAIYFPAKPPTPPSPSSAEERIDYFTAIRKMFKNIQMILVLVVFAFSFGVPVVWIAVLNLSLKDIGIHQDEAIGVAVTGVVCSSITAFIAARITDKVYGHLKITVIILLGISSLFFLWFLLLTTQVITPSLGQVYAAVAGGLSFEYATVPLLVELAVEIGFPIPENVTGATLTFVFNLVSLVFLGLFQIPNEGHLWVSCVLLACVSLSIIPLVFVKETHKRSDTDRKLM